VVPFPRRWLVFARRLGVFVSVFVSFVGVRRGSGTAAVGLVEHVTDADDRP
jgi:hypothetical protein